jgi:hypothetical protein
MINREQIKDSVKEIRELGNKISPSFGPEFPDLAASLKISIYQLLHKKFDAAVADKFGFYTFEELLETIEVLDEKPEEKPRPTIVKSFARPAEVRPEPTLESSPKPTVHKDGKRPVSKRV